MRIYLGNGWMVHSSDRGTTLAPMTGWYETRFAWGEARWSRQGSTSRPQARVDSTQSEARKRSSSSTEGGVAPAREH
jgi:hypothetical protein